jgi:hypothetical protein
MLTSAMAGASEVEHGPDERGHARQQGGVRWRKGTTGDQIGAAPLANGYRNGLRRQASAVVLGGSRWGGATEQEEERGGVCESEKLTIEP